MRSRLHMQALLNVSGAPVGGLGVTPLLLPTPTCGALLLIATADAVTAVCDLRRNLAAATIQWHVPFPRSASPRDHARDHTRDHARDHSRDHASASVITGSVGAAADPRAGVWLQFGSGATTIERRAALDGALLQVVPRDPT
mmetsp:Transcript_43488/g.127977  ORF Transcript_43488/g.127977 Transcript_43488/m.127977 type:complete len:142 (-) Transcript_43488:46-471(-)